MVLNNRALLGSFLPPVYCESRVAQPEPQGPLGRSAFIKTPIRASPCGQITAYPTITCGETNMGDFSTHTHTHIYMHSNTKRDSVHPAGLCVI